MKKIIIIAGPNGAGKTTFARDFLPAEAKTLRFINADLIAAGLAPFNPESAAFKAGRLMLEEIDECVDAGHSFAFETTLSGLVYMKKIAVWQAHGYQVKLWFLSLPNEDIAVSRVASRVLQGGHNIPEDVSFQEFKEKVDSADQDDDATEKDVENAAKNIIMQLRKSVSMRGNKDVEFSSGKQKVDMKIAQKALDMYNKMKPQDKTKFQNTIAKSYKDLLNAIKGN